MHGYAPLSLFLATLTAERATHCTFKRPWTSVLSHEPILNKIMGCDKEAPISYEQFCRAAAHMATRKEALRRVIARVCRPGNYRLLEQWRQSGRYPLSLYGMHALARTVGSKKLAEHYAALCDQRRARETERRRARLAVANDGGQ
jgi:hypothetical protein